MYPSANITASMLSTYSKHMQRSGRSSFCFSFSVATGAPLWEAIHSLPGDAVSQGAVDQDVVHQDVFN